MPRTYTGNSDARKNGSTRPGLKKFMDLAMKRWGFTNLGAYNYRVMNNPKAKADPTNPKSLSVHSTGRACDLGYKDRKAAEQAWEWMLANAAALGIEEIHDYAFDPDGGGPGKPWGRGFRCSRGEGARGVKIYDEKVNAGTPGGKWLHFELSPEMADNPAKLEAAWNKIAPPAAVAATKPVLITPNPATAKSTGGRPAPTPAPAAPKPAPAAADKFPGDIKKGAKGAAVKKVQQKIGATVDGDYGAKTEAAVKAWQKKNKIKETGVVDAATWKKLFG